MKGLVSSVCIDKENICSQKIILLVDSCLRKKKGESKHFQWAHHSGNQEDSKMSPKQRRTKQSGIVY